MLCLLATSACRQDKSAADVPVVTVGVAPDPPIVGTVILEVAAKDASGRPVAGGAVRVEANMTHPGMTPTFADCRETTPGVYRGPLELTMPGDWQLEIEASFPGGAIVRKSLDLPGVRGR